MRQYSFVKKLRIVAVLLNLAYLLFGAGAIFTEYKASPFLWISAFIIAVNLVTLITHRPAPYTTVEPNPKDPKSITERTE